MILTLLLFTAWQYLQLLLYYLKYFLSYHLKLQHIISQFHKRLLSLLVLITTPTANTLYVLQNSIERSFSKIKFKRYKTNRYILSFNKCLRQINKFNFSFLFKKIKFTTLMLNYSRFKAKSSGSYSGYKYTDIMSKHKWLLDFFNWKASFRFTCLSFLCFYNLLI